MAVEIRRDTVFVGTVVIDGSKLTITGDLPIAEGGTGASSASAALANLGGMSANLFTFNSKTASYTALVTDVGHDKLIVFEGSGNKTFTIPNNTSSPWTVGSVVNAARTGAGTVTIAGEAGVTFIADPGLKLRAQGSVVTCVKMATNVWLITGDTAA